MNPNLTLFLKCKCSVTNLFIHYRFENENLLTPRDNRGQIKYKISKQCNFMMKLFMNVKAYRYVAPVYVHLAQLDVSLKFLIFDCKEICLKKLNSLEGSG